LKLRAILRSRTDLRWQPHRTSELQQTGLPKIHVEHDGICRGYALGKNAKGSFPSNDNISKGILDLVHIDLCGSMIVASLSGYLYYVIFIDDHSRKTWIYFLKTKDGVLASFQEYRAQVENLTGKKIKVLSVAALYTPGRRGRNLQSTRCVLGGK
jgi:hypothetical protein